MSQIHENILPIRAQWCEGYFFKSGFSVFLPLNDLVNTPYLVERRNAASCPCGIARESVKGCHRWPIHRKLEWNRTVYCLDGVTLEKWVQLYDRLTLGLPSGWIWNSSDWDVPVHLDKIFGVFSVTDRTSLSLESRYVNLIKRSLIVLRKETIRALIVLWIKEPMSNPVCWYCEPLILDPLYSSTSG